MLHAACATSGSAAAEDAGEDVTEAASSCGASSLASSAAPGEVRKIKAAKIESRAAPGALL